MTVSVNAKVYSADSFQKDIVAYNGPAKTGSVKDDLRLSRVAPKPSATFSGLSRTEAKLTRTLNLTGSLTPTGDLICTISLAVPVGYTAADIDTALNDMGAFLASASFKTHVKTPQISF
ncbi:coat protein [ssRNA phage Gephyllon.3_7]|jgi:hypothetical protein|uniref:Coat protein n=2 Tax=Norzivirales TaxID=2842247 RepID=A0A8S5KXB9_9VIRU|nr:coat protein [ssRNA phage Gephyllon.3_7]QDH87040.1 MAG: hypothetical protein H3BulkLitter171094_000002 [Leviviridae sp.]DAD50214.1 TPA_asm: coat protein [ssRNA phage Gephyllon.3_7]